ncbi:phage holin family protein [Curtobacterium sp. MCSS17_005]|uniref:phage holin family protein n=1 Tax=Curtobacterium sp. MCSS17_005 TaxID=2175641 RepID=UPI0011B6B9E8|nr:phage holin family protein [Curtobacterium sp. MCSS17_005]WIB32695.1 phage holin family protein [Curtobacterium sp. MCSS17_005]
MTNDDRNDQDRTGDGQAPRWGDAPQQQPDAEAPRYGERVDPAPTSTPQYGEQYGQGQQQYGQQSGQGQQQYGQPSSTPSWNDQQRHDQHHDQQPYAAAPAHAGAPAWQSHDEPKPKKKKTVGIIAFVLGLLALVLGVIGGYIMGSAISNSGALSDLLQNGSTTVTPEMQNEIMSDPAVRSQFMGGIAVAGVAAVLGLWALVQGIIAAVTKRGRGWGIFAIILAVVATIATIVTYIGVAAASAMGSAS